MYYIYASLAVLGLLAGFLMLFGGGLIANALLAMVIGAVFAVAAEVAEFSATYNKVLEERKKIKGH